LSSLATLYRFGGTPLRAALCIAIFILRDIRDIRDIDTRSTRFPRDETREVP